MDIAGRIEEDIDEEEGLNDTEHETLIAPSSFYPQDYPDHTSHLNPHNFQRIGSSDQSRREEIRAIPRSRRYLPCHYFDYCCGASTGGIIAIMVSRLRMTAADCLWEYKLLGISPAEK